MPNASEHPRGAPEAGPAYHPILRRQLRRLGLSQDAPPDLAPWSALLRRVSDSYTEADDDRYTLERSLEISDAEMRALHDVLSGQTRRDELTGLPNRLALTALLTESLACRREGGHEVAVLFIDLDGFKLVNDSLGHAAGDELLVRTAERIRLSIRDHDIVARLGGDEFVVLCRDIDELATAETVASRIAGHLDQPFRVAGQDAMISASIGITLTGLTDIPSAEEALREADMAMYEAKLRGRSQCAVYTLRLRARVDARTSTQKALSTAVEHRELRVHYQPIVRLADHRLLALEALVRWQRPGRGLVPPDEFIQVAEQSRLITAIDGWVVEQACAAAASWPDAEILVTVNMSVRDLKQDHFVELVSTAVHRAGLAPHRLVLDLSENTIMSGDPAVAANLAGLRAMGVQVAIDDFGTGHSALSMLRELPVQSLKLDRSFVAALSSDPAASAIPGAIIRMGHALGLIVVAEGVEDADQAGRLRDLGCDAAQGYLFARPTPVDELAGFFDAAPFGAATR